VDTLATAAVAIFGFLGLVLVASFGFVAGYLWRGDVRGRVDAPVIRVPFGKPAKKRKPIAITDERAAELEAEERDQRRP